MRWAFAADDENWLWKPTRKAQPRLVGFGITTATAAVQLEIKDYPGGKDQDGYHDPEVERSEA